MFHPKRVSEWLSGKNIYPLYAEISPSGTCNHRCTYCALDFMEYKKVFLDTALLKERLAELANLGLKSVMYAGEGEPLLHKHIADIVEYTKSAGIDVALTTNGSLLNNDIAESIISNSSWIKVSINGATKETYSKIHGINPKSKSFENVIANMAHASDVRNTKGHKCALGMQLLLLPDNAHEVEPLAKLARDIGMDYLVVKPYSQHPLSKTSLYSDIKYDDYLQLSQELEKHNSEHFKVVFRVDTMKNWDKGEHTYKTCQALPFWSYIDASGGVWGCSVYLTDERFYYGNINDLSFEDIWQGDKRRASLNYIRDELDTSACRVNCRMDKINGYLRELTNPSEHVNFI